MSPCHGAVQCRGGSSAGREVSGVWARGEPWIRVEGQLQKKREASSEVHLATRCRANMAHIRQSRPDSGLAFQVKVPKTQLRRFIVARKRHARRQGNSELLSKIGRFLEAMHGLTAIGRHNQVHPYLRKGERRARMCVWRFTRGDRGGTPQP